MSENEKNIRLVDDIEYEFRLEGKGVSGELLIANAK